MIVPPRLSSVALTYRPLLGERYACISVAGKSVGRQGQKVAWQVAVRGGSGVPLTVPVVPDRMNANSSSSRDQVNPPPRFWTSSDESDRFLGHFAHTTRSILGLG
jgi:hypothetical protein